MQVCKNLICFSSGSRWTSPSGETSARRRGSTLPSVLGATRARTCQDQQRSSGGMGGRARKTDHQVWKGIGKVRNKNFSKVEDNFSPQWFPKLNASDKGKTKTFVCVKKCLIQLWFELPTQ